SHLQAALAAAHQLTDERMLAVPNFIGLQVSRQLSKDDADLEAALADLNSVHQYVSADIYQQCMARVIALQFDTMVNSDLPLHVLLGQLVPLVRDDTEPHLRATLLDHLKRYVAKQPEEIGRLVLELLAPAAEIPAHTFAEHCTAQCLAQLSKAAASQKDAHWQHCMQTLRAVEHDEIEQFIEDTQGRRNRRPMALAKSLLSWVKRPRKKDS
ncbi:MAG: hypothetical protein AAF420_01645, partial [Pseudomonadota bacterium]